MANRPPKRRLDALLVERGLVESRAKAQALILAGEVWMGGSRIDKPGRLVPEGAEIRVQQNRQRYVSRGGLKLEHGLDAFRIEVRGKICADVGASTGGFTDCLLQRGARKVYALDVGYGQLHEKLRSDARVVVRERTNARFLSEREVPEKVDLLTIDVSFISLRLIIPAAVTRLRRGGYLVALIKPQFEVGRGKVGKGGVVRDEGARAEAIDAIRTFCAGHSLDVRGVVDSPIAGPAGNLEALMAAELSIAPE